MDKKHRAAVSDPRSRSGRQTCLGELPRKTSLKGTDFLLPGGVWMGRVSTEGQTHFLTHSLPEAPPWGFASLGRKMIVGKAPEK